MTTANMNQDQLLAMFKQFVANGGSIEQVPAVPKTKEKAKAKPKKKVVSLKFLAAKSNIGVYGVFEDGSLTKSSDWMSIRLYKMLLQGTIKLPALETMDKYQPKES